MTMAAVNSVHRAVVVEVVLLSPGMTRIVFGGDGLEGFVSTGVGDEYLRLFLPADGHTEPVLPEPTADGYWRFPDGEHSTVVRTYTVRAWDPEARRLTIDFVIHDGGVAARWAAGAQPGHVVGVNTPRGMYAAPESITWQLLIADLTGLPAAIRLAEQAFEGVRTSIVIEVGSPADELPTELPRGVDLTWVHGGNGHGPSRLEGIVRAAAFPAAQGYVWVAGEARATRAIRRYLRHELGLAADAYKVIGYWTEDSERWMQRYETLPEELRSHLRQIWQDDERDVEEVTDEYEETLEAHGL